MKKKEILWILIFALLFGSPFVSWFFLKNSVDTQNYENREVTEMPKISLEEYAQFPQQYETYFNDNIPWRNQLISLNSGLDLFAFRDSSNENVLIGKDGWLFFTGGTNPVEQSTGQRLLSEDDLEKIAGQLTLVQRWVQSRGEKFIFFLAPNKETIYREKLPESETVVTDETEAFQLINYLKEHKRGLYTELLISGTLKQHLIEIDESATDKVNRLINQFAEQENVNENLKEYHQVEWVQAMNSIKNRAEEIVFNEILYV